MASSGSGDFEKLCQIVPSGDSLYRTITQQVDVILSAASKQILCGFGIDVNAVDGWLGSYGGQDGWFFSH